MLRRADSLRVPSYRRHKPSGQAVVTLNGRDHYLGVWNTKVSHNEYDRLIGLWFAGGRFLPEPQDDGPTLAELCLAYLNHAKGYYQKEGRDSGSITRIRVAIKTLREYGGHTPAASFGPLALQAVRQRLVDKGNSRTYINHLVSAIKRVFRWGSSQELMPVEAYQALTTVAGLQRGRTKAREPEPIRPVADEVVDATLPRLPQVVADMVRFQRLTGCRPGELCILRPCDVDISGEVWIYRPESHKTEHHGHDRVICIGPKAQNVLRPYLLREKTTYCFSPAESERGRRAAAHAKRKTPLAYGNRPGTNRRRNPKRHPGDRYDTNTYRRAIHYAVDAINKEREKNEVEERLPRWSPNRLRHTAATEIRKKFGLEAAQVTLGHSQADVTQIYAEKNLTLAVEVARKIG